MFPSRIDLRVLAASLALVALLAACEEKESGTKTPPGDLDTITDTPAELDEIPADTDDSAVDVPAETTDETEDPADNPTEGDQTVSPAEAARLRCGDDFPLQIVLDDACYPEQPHGVKQGDILRDIEFEDCDGAKVKLSDYVGKAKAVLLTESAGWCTVCREEVKRLESLYQKYKDQGFVILQPLYQNNSGARSTRAFCKSWRDEYSLTYPVLNDPGHQTEPYHPNPAQLATPLNMIIDRNMRIRVVVEGLYPHTLEPQVRGLLGLDE